MSGKNRKGTKKVPAKKQKLSINKPQKVIKKMILVEDCFHCLIKKKCNVLKSLKGEERDAIVNHIGLQHVILKGCPLPNALIK